MLQGQQDFTYCAKGHCNVWTVVCIHVYCIYHYIQSAYVKLKETLFNSVIWPWIHFHAAAKKVGGCLCFIWLFLSLCLPSLKSRCWDMLSGSGCKGRMESAMVWGGGLVVSVPTDQITAGISSSVSIRSKEVNPPGSIWGKKCDNHNGQAPFAFKCENFGLSIQLNWDEQCGPQCQCAWGVI